MDADGDATGGDRALEDQEDRDEVDDDDYEEEEEEEEDRENESWSSENNNDVEESESESESSDESFGTGDLIGRLQINDRTLHSVCIGSDIELHQVCTAVQENSNITRFDIFDSVIDLNAATAISAALARMPHLSDFSIGRCDCGNLKATSMLVSALGNKGSITTLYWCSSNLGDRGAQAIASSFSRNSELRTLFLTGNNISNDGVTAVATLIKSNSSLSGVHLNGNNIGAEGAQSLAKAVIQNQSLERLYFSKSNSDYATRIFEKALYNDESIESIIDRSNHTLKYMEYLGADLIMLLGLNKYGPENARRRKIIRFLNAKPTSLLSMNLNEALMPKVLCKIGRDCFPNAMFELLRNMPDLFRSPAVRPHQH